MYLLKIQKYAIILITLTPLYAMAKTILIADDDSTIVKLFQLDIEGRNGDVAIHSTDSGEGTISAIDRVKPDVIVLDIRMPRGDGFSVLDYLKENNMDIPVVIVTNYRNEDYVKKSKTFSNVREYIVKHEVRVDRVFQAVSAHLA